MARKDKALYRFLQIPTDYQWDEMVYLLTALGYQKYEKEGSRVRFFRAEDKAIVLLHRPHPGNIVKEYVVKQTRDKLRDNGDIDE